MAFGILLLLFACRKDIDFIIQGKEKPPSLVSESAKIWRLQRLDKTLPTQQQLAPQWDDSWIEQSSDGNSMLIVPARENRVNNKNVQIRRFFIFSVVGQNVSDGRIVEFLGLNYNIETNLRFLIRNYASQIITGFDGGVLQYDVNYRQVSGVLFESGVNTGSKIEVLTQPGGLHQALNENALGIQAASGLCPPITPQLIGFPPVVNECYYTFNRVTTFDEDTGCAIDILHMYISHFCPGSGEDGSTSSGTASGSGVDGGTSPPYGGNPGNPGPGSSSAQNSPCDGVTKANLIKSKPIVNNTISAIKNNSMETAHKFFVNSKNDYNTFALGPAISGGLHM